MPFLDPHATSPNFARCQRTVGACTALTTLVLALVACSSDLEKVDRLEGEWRVLGTLKAGKKHGKWLTLDPDGQKFELETWRNGYLHGMSMSWHENGTLQSDTVYRHNRGHGRFRIFYSDGRIAELGWWRKGRPIGTWCDWAPFTGKLEKITRYAGGRAKFVDDAPDGPCPLTQGDGRRHLDPTDANYE